MFIIKEVYFLLLQITLYKTNFYLLSFLLFTPHMIVPLKALAIRNEQRCVSIVHWTPNATFVKAFPHCPHHWLLSTNQRPKHLFPITLLNSSFINIVVSVLKNKITSPMRSEPLEARNAGSIMRFPPTIISKQ